MFTLVTIPTGKPFIATAMEVVSDEYATLANRIGASQLVTTSKAFNESVAFEALLAEMGLRQYRFKDVQRFLNRQYGWGLCKGTPWGFRPLREADQTTNGHFIAADGTIDNTRKKWRRWHNGSVLGGMDWIREKPIRAKLYAKPIPLPVLRTVETIALKFPSAQFYVSDDHHRRLNVVKDPFLMVRCAGKDYIIERWDEPGFRG